MLVLVGRCLGRSEGALVQDADSHDRTFESRDGKAFPMSSAAVVKAKRFVINRIVDYAKRNNVPLTELEVSMLGFAKTSASQRDSR